MRKRLGGARGRVLLAFVVLLVLHTALTTVLLRGVLLARAGERADAALAQEVSELRRLVADGRNPETGRPFGRDVRAMFDVFLSRNVPAEGETILTFAGDQPYRESDGASVPAELQRRIRSATRAVVRGEVREGERRLRYLAVPVRAEGQSLGVFAVTTDLGVEEREAEEAVRVAGLVGLLALALASLLGLFVVGRVLRPLREMSDTAARITDTDLTRRIPATGHDEIGDLGRTFNALLDRLEAAFSSQRALVSDAGHELRTPVTIIRGHLDVVGDDPEERAETMAIVQDELDRMSRLIDDLLTLAKAERTDFLRPETLDLDVLTAELHAKAQSLDPSRTWRLSGTGTGTLIADRQRLTQAVMNLADNATRHSPPGGAIVLGSVLENGTARFSVSDYGPGISPREHERIFERFTRGAGARAGVGSGLGLAIVRAIAEAHGGRVELSTEPGRGSTFTLVIPTRVAEVPT